MDSPEGTLVRVAVEDDDPGGVVAADSMVARLIAAATWS